MQRCNSLRNFIVALSATVRFKRSNWLECYCYHYLLLTQTFYYCIISGLSRYLKVWQRYFAPLKVLNSRIGVERAENLLWRAMNLSISPSLKNLVKLCGTNNLFTDSLTNRANCIVNIGSCLLEKSSNTNVFISGLIPRNESWSINSVLIKDINRILEQLCLKHDCSFRDQSKGWTIPNGDLDLSLVFRDSLHFIKEGNVKLAKL